VQITNEFRIAIEPDRAYELLLDLEQVTPCLPGAELGDVKDDGSHAVTVTVKLGPMRFVYDGTVAIAERDAAARRAVMVGSARETRGQGSAKATIAMTVGGAGAGSKVDVVADVDLTGRAAQMGRGIVEDVAKRMIADMASCLEQRFAEPAASPAGSASTAEATPAPESKPIRAGSLVFTVLLGKLRALFTSRR
jgi:carbon monoxide dehydrogenase subunit G